jgi:hypothetical protein
MLLELPESRSAAGTLRGGQGGLTHYCSPQMLHL